MVFLNSINRILLFKDMLFLILGDIPNFSQKRLLKDFIYSFFVSLVPGIIIRTQWAYD